MIFSDLSIFAEDQERDHDRHRFVRGDELRMWHEEAKGHDLPERHLAIAVLIQAVRDLVGTYTFQKENMGRRCRRDARTWFTTNTPDPLGLSFAFCAEAAGIDPVRLRDKLLNSPDELKDLLKEAMQWAII